MLSENDRESLLRNLNRNRVVLVTGSGFSWACSSTVSDHLPVGNDLAAALYEFVYKEPYDGKSSLKSLYGAASKREENIPALREFIKQQLHATKIPDWYKTIPHWFWRRIYTFNADDVLEQVFEKSRLDVIVAPDSFVERDQFLHKQQYIKLHGSINDPKDLTFGPKDYGTRAAARTDIWYLHFVEDYATQPTLFVGTSLDEPIFWQYVEARGSGVVNGEQIRRPKCFIVTEHISKPDADNLERYNIHPIKAKAEDFFAWLHEQQDILSRENVLRLVDSSLEPALKASEANKPAKIVADTELFFSVFRVPMRPATPHASAMYLLGAAPSWDDIAADMDAPREFNQPLHELLVAAVREDKADVIQIGSPAGGGKSTACRRAAITLVDEGYSVFFSDASTRPDATRLADHIRTLGNRCFLFFDNAGSDLLQIADLWKLVKDLPHPPVFVVSARLNDLAFYGPEFARGGAVVADFALGDLTERDCVSLVRTLDKYDLLGALKDKTERERLAVFQEKARKQILVAMKEATSGRGFDEIIRDEYQKLTNEDAKLLYLISSIASDDGYGLSVEAMISAMGLPPNETISLIETALKGILIPQAERDTYSIRHPAIASFIIGSAPRKELAVAVGSLLISLATVMPTNRKEKRKTRAFRLYRRIVSHTFIQSYFPAKSLARSIYDEIKDYYRDDGHYWLQYASYEIEGGGDIALAENYLKQAEALLGSTTQVETAMAHLLFRKAEFAFSVAEAGQYKEDALRILRTHMGDRNSVSLHALHLFGDQMLAFIEKWTPVIERSGAYGRVLKEFSAATPDHLQGHPMLESTSKKLKKAQLETFVRPR